MRICFSCCGDCGSAQNFPGKYRDGTTKSRAPVGSDRIISVVSISQNPRSTKKPRMKLVTSCRSRISSLERARRRSR